MLTLEDLIIDSSESLKAAMQRMTRNRRGVVFVCDDDAHLVGVLSDGDIRRTLLGDTLLVSPLHSIMNTDPITAKTAEEATDLVRKLAVVAVPVVDSEGCVQKVAVESQDQVIIVSRESSGKRTNDTGIQTGTVGIIPARGGSKRIPRKNLALLRGRPLVSWAVQTAKGSPTISHVLVSTDDSDIAETARNAGASVPWLRPAELSQDTTPTLDVLLHAVEWSVAHLSPRPEFGVLLEPTAPLRRPEHLEAALALLAASDADCAMTVSEVPHVLNPEELLTLENECVRPYLPYRTMDTRCLRGQQSTVYVQNGLVYAFRIASLLRNRSLYGQKTLPVVTSWSDFLDIDTEDDLRAAAVRLDQA